MATMDEVLAKVREADTIVDSLREGFLAARQSLEEAKAISPEDDSQVKIDEAIQLLDAMIVENAAVVTVNTPAEEPPLVQPEPEPAPEPVVEPVAEEVPEEPAP